MADYTALAVLFAERVAIFVFKHGRLHIGRVSCYIVSYLCNVFGSRKVVADARNRIVSSAFLSLPSPTFT